MASLFVAPVKPVELRDYQTEAVDELRARFRQHKRRVMLCAPTGSGKTVMAIDIARRAIDKGSGVWFIADRTTLIDQAINTFVGAGLEVGRIQGDYPVDPYAPVQVVSAQTIVRRRLAINCDLAVVDEAHTQHKDICAELVKNDIRAIGLSATPLTKGLASTWQDIVTARTTRRLIGDGWLHEPVVYCAAREPNMRGARTDKGEWAATDAGNRVRPLIGDIVSTWVMRTGQHFGGPCPTLLFGSTIDHTKEICEAFQASGYDFRMATGHKKSDGCEDNIAAFQAQTIVGLGSVEKLARGFDAPHTMCLIIARPLLSSLSTHIQILGRVMRTAPQKVKALVLDHMGNCAGFQDATEAFWTHSIAELPEEAIVAKRASKRERKARMCPDCRRLLPVGERECECGWKGRKRKAMTAQPGELKQMKLMGDPWLDLQQMAKERYPTAADDEAVKTKACKWMCVQYKELVGRWPSGKSFNPTAVGREANPRVRELVNKAFKRWIMNKKRKLGKAS